MKRLTATSRLPPRCAHCEYYIYADVRRGPRHEPLCDGKYHDRFCHVLVTQEQHPTPCHPCQVALEVQFLQENTEHGYTMGSASVYPGCTGWCAMCEAAAQVYAFFPEFAAQYDAGVADTRRWQRMKTTRRAYRAKRGRRG